jgi:hypothetical protein
MSYCVSCPYWHQSNLSNCGNCNSKGSDDYNRVANRKPSQYDLWAYQHSITKAAEKQEESKKYFKGRLYQELFDKATELNALKEKMPRRLNIANTTKKQIIGYTTHPAFKQNSQTLDSAIYFLDCYINKISENKTALDTTIKEVKNLDNHFFNNTMDLYKISQQLHAVINSCEEKEEDAFQIWDKFKKLQNEIIAMIQQYEKHPLNKIKKFFGKIR